MSECLFCQIARGELPAEVVYEDAQLLAFLDLHPIRTGHLLVVPKLHEPDFYNLEPALYTAMMQTAQTLAAVLAQTQQPQKVGLMVSGFHVPHAHIHLVPMHHPDDLTSQAYVHGLSALRKTPLELKAVAEPIRRALQGD